MKLTLSTANQCHTNARRPRRAGPRGLRRQASDERGAVLVIVAALMLVFLASGALAVDLGSFYSAKRNAQSAADAAVLAAAQDLPDNASSVNADVKTYVAENDPRVPATILPYPDCMTSSTPGICINYPYQSNTSDIQVKLVTTAPSSFGAFVGFTSAKISAMAAAGATGANRSSAIFADSTSCANGGVTISGSTNTINGATTSNAGLSISGSGNTLGATSYGGPNGCSQSVASGNTVNGTAGANATTTRSPWPEDFSSAYPSACTQTADTYSWTTSNMEIPAGVYCATTSISLKANNLTGNVTFIAPTLTVSGSNLNFTPNYKGLTYYQTGSTGLQLSGASLNSGAVFAPNATVTITGTSISATGFVEAQSVVIKATGFNFTGDGPSATNGSFALIG